MEVMWQILPWIMSVITIWSMWLAGNKNVLAWKVGLTNQILWLTFNIHFHVWGFMPTTAFLIYVYTRNLIKWREDAKRVSEEYQIRQRLERV